MQDVVLHYYAGFKFSTTHRRWRDAAVHGGMKGEAMLAGERQERLWAKLSEWPPLRV